MRKDFFIQILTLANFGFLINNIIIGDVFFGIIAGIGFLSGIFYLFGENKNDY